MLNAIRIPIPESLASEPWFKYLLIIVGVASMLYYMFFNKEKMPKKKHIVTPQTEKAKQWDLQTPDTPVNHENEEQYQEEKPGANAIARAAEELKSVVEQTYALRKKTLTTQKILWAVVGVVFIVGIGFIIANNQNRGTTTDYTTIPYKYVLLLVPFIAISLITRLYTTQMSRYKGMEQTALATMVKKLFPNFIFSIGKSVPYGEIKKSRLFPWVESHTLQTVFGQMQKETPMAKINFADIGFMKENPGGNTSRILMSIPILNVIKSFMAKDTADKQMFTFRGLLCRISFNKNIDGTIMVLPNNFSQALNNLFASKIKEDKVVLEDQRFNNEFTVFATDQIEAHYILSTSVMEKMTELKHSFRQEIALSFTDNNMYLSVKKPEGLFALPEEKMNNAEFFQQVVDLIYMILNIVNDLRLHNGMSRSKWEELQQNINKSIE